MDSRKLGRQGYGCVHPGLLYMAASLRKWTTRDSISLKASGPCLGKRESWRRWQGAQAGETCRLNNHFSIASGFAPHCYRKASSSSPTGSSGLIAPLYKVQVLHPSELLCTGTHAAHHALPQALPLMHWDSLGKSESCTLKPQFWHLCPF